MRLVNGFCGLVNGFDSVWLSEWLDLTQLVDSADSVQLSELTQISGQQTSGDDWRLVWTPIWLILAALDSSFRELQFDILYANIWPWYHFVKY